MTETISLQSLQESVTLRSVHGRVITAEEDGVVRCRVVTADAWETWLVERKDGCRVALRSAHGTYLSVDDVLRVQAKARDEAGPWEEFSVEAIGPNAVALKSWQNTYLCAEPDGRVVCDRPSVGPYETWTSSLATVVAPARRTGPVRLVNRCFADDQGPDCFLGASMFWLVWGIRHDRDRAIENLRWLASAGVQFVRVLAEVGGASWADRTVDPRSPDWSNQIREATLAAKALGLRIEWTLFGGGCLTKEYEWSQACDRFIEAVGPYQSCIQFVEIQNEGLGPGVALARQLASRVRAMLPVPVAITGCPEPELPAIYKDSRATLMTLHCDRSYQERGYRPIRQIKHELSDVPGAWVNNEPIGIASSVAHEENPVRLAAGAITTWVVGSAAHVVHHGAGIYGRAYLGPTGPRLANAWEQPTLEPTLDLIAAAKARLPKELPNWRRIGHGNTGHPLGFHTPVGDAVEAGADGCNRAYSAVSGDGRWVCFIAGIRGHVEFDLGGRSVLWSLQYARRGEGKTEHVTAGRYTLSAADWGECVLLVSE